MSHPASILIIKPSSLGDVVHTLPALHCLKRAWPESRISWVVNPEWMPLLEGNPDLAEIVPFPRRDFRGMRGVLDFWQWSARIAEIHPDLVLDFQGLLRSALIARRSGAPRVLGLSDAREGARFFYQQTAAVRGIPHAVDRYLALARLAGAPDCGEAVFLLPEGQAPHYVLPEIPFVAVHPFSRGNGKSLTNVECGMLLESLAPIPVVLVGKGNVPAGLPPHVMSCVGETTLPELLYILRRAAFTVSVDSGPMHIAAGLGSNLVSIHTWSDPEKVGPYPGGSWVWKSGILCRRSEYQALPGPVRPGREHFEAMAVLIRRELSSKSGH